MTVRTKEHMAAWEERYVTSGGAGGGTMNAEGAETAAFVRLAISESYSLTVWDWGCGACLLWGVTLPAPEDVHYTGIDISPKAIGYASKKFPRAHFTVGDLVDLLPTLAPKDAVICTDLLFHLHGDDYDVVSKALFDKARRVVFLKSIYGEHANDPKSYHWDHPVPEAPEGWDLVTTKSSFNKLAKYHLYRSKE